MSVLQSEVHMAYNWVVSGLKLELKVWVMCIISMCADIFKNFRGMGVQRFKLSFLFHHIFL